jgi:Zn finger protein HypA/HybF involved in hydrogenase expression
MPVTAICNNTYKDDKGKDKKCGEVEPTMDPKTEKVFCSKCNKEIPNMNHFQKMTMKTLRQFRQKEQIPFGVKCQNCGKEAQPKVVKDDIVCPACAKPHTHLSEPFKIMLKDKLKTTNQDVA